MYEQTNKYKYSNKDLCTINALLQQHKNQIKSEKKCVQKQLKSVLGGLLVLAGLTWYFLAVLASCIGLVSLKKRLDQHKPA